MTVKEIMKKLKCEVSLGGLNFCFLLHAGSQAGLDLMKCAAHPRHGIAGTNTMCRCFTGEYLILQRGPGTLPDFRTLRKSIFDSRLSSREDKPRGERAQQESVRS